MIRPNALHPPFNDPRARRALAMAVDQKAFLAAMIGNPDFEKECYAVFQCGTPNETDVATEPFRKRDLETAKRLLKESGYDGRPIVIMDPTDQQIIHNIAIMTAQTLKDIGANVDLQAMDWATLTTRRGRKDAPGPGSLGWNIFTTWSSAAIMHSPVTNFALQATCDGNNWFGWACDDEIERLRKVYIAATKDADRRKAIEDLQRRYYEVVPFVITGQFQSPIAYRKSLVGLPDSLLLTVWNTEKK
jgi:peptide/nickel transport system substrate-binding protein